MKPVGCNSKDFGCCPGHDKVPYKDQYETKRGKRDQKFEFTDTKKMFEIIRKYSQYNKTK